MTCDAKIRPFPGPTELTCELEHDELVPITEHQGTVRDYAYAGSTTVLYWLEADRRNFRGEWRPCFSIAGQAALSLPSSNCVLPSGHRGRCAE